MKIKDGLNTKDMRHKAVALQSKMLTDDGEFEGYGSVFGNTDSYGDVVAKGAFAATLAEHAAAGTMPALLWQHNTHLPIGIYTEMREDDRGLYVKGKLLLETQLGREAHALLKVGALKGLSIGYRAKKWEYDEDSDVLMLLEVDLWECSVVTFPANTEAQVSGVKAKSQISDLASWKQYEAFLREEGKFSNEAATAMVARARHIRDNERDARDAMSSIKAGADRLLNNLSK